MPRFVLVFVFLAACDTGPVPPELYYGPNGQRLGAEPFPAGLEGPWLGVRNSGRSIMFEDEMAYSINVERDVYEQVVISRCDRLGPYRIQDGFVVIKVPDEYAPTYIAYTLSDGGAVLSLVGVDGIPNEVEDYVRPVKMLHVEDCRRIVDRGIVDSVQPFGG